MDHTREPTGPGSRRGRTYRGSSKHGVAPGVSHISTGKVVPQDFKNPVVVPFLRLPDHLPGNTLLGAAGPKGAAVPLQDGRYVPASVSTLVPGNTTGFIGIGPEPGSPTTRKSPGGGGLPPSTPLSSEPSELPFLPWALHSLRSHHSSITLSPNGCLPVTIRTEYPVRRTCDLEVKHSGQVLPQQGLQLCPWLAPWTAYCFTGNKLSMAGP